MNTRLSLSVIALAAVCTSAAYATTITPPTTVTSPQSSVTPSTLTTSQVGAVVSTVSGAVTAATFTGSYTENVFHDANNVYNAQCGAADCLTFVITFTGVAPGAMGSNSVEQITTGDGSSNAFAGVATNVGYVTGSGSDAPTTATESFNGTIGFDFSVPIAQGGSADTLIIQTNALMDTAGLVSFQDSSATTNAGFVPVASTPAVTPEPSSLALLGTGLVGVAGIVRRRFKA